MQGEIRSANGNLRTSPPMHPGDLIMVTVLVKLKKMSIAITQCLESVITLFRSAQGNVTLTTTGTTVPSCWTICSFHERDSLSSTRIKANDRGLRVRIYRPDHQCIPTNRLRIHCMGLRTTTMEAASPTTPKTYLMPFQPRADLFLLLAP